MTTAKKQNSTVKSILGILPAVVLLITMQLITAYAADNNPALTTLDSFPAIYNSTDTMNVNNGTINTLYNGGTVKENNGKISSSRGSVYENHGIIEDLSAGHVGTNNGTVNLISNTGSLTVNDNDGTILVIRMGNVVERNYGTIQENIGIISENYGTIAENYGTVTMHSGQITKNCQNGTVTFEAKTVNGETIPAEGTVDTNEGHVKIHSGVVKITENTGDIEIDNATVTVDKNSGNITVGDNATLICSENKNGGVITKTSESAVITCTSNDGSINDETAVMYKIVFVGDGGQAEIISCDFEKDGIYYTENGGGVVFTLPPEYACKDAIMIKAENTSAWGLNAAPEQGSTEFIIICHKCSDDDYEMTAEKHWQRCTECGRTFNESAHTAGDYISDDNSTCIKDGTETYSCAECGYRHTRTVTGSHLTSNYHKNVVIDQRVEPTVTSDGLTQGSHCEDCHKVLTAQEIIPKIPHTCVSSSDYLHDGSTHWKVCSVCNKKFDEGTHNYINPVLNKAATCNESATYYMQCDICGATDDTQTVIIGDPPGHSFKNYVSDGNATYTADGTKTAKCENCDATDTVADIGSKKGHSFGAWTSVSDTQHQRVCSDDETHTEIENHSYSEWTTVKEPSETETGVRKRSCSACGHEETKVIPVLENTHNDTPQNGTPATQTPAGASTSYTRPSGKESANTNSNIRITDVNARKVKSGNGSVAPEHHNRVNNSSVSANPANLTPPQTGDNGNILLRAALLLVSSVVLVGTAVFGKRKKRLQIIY